MLKFFFSVLILFGLIQAADARTLAQSQACATENARLVTAATNDRDVQTYALRAMTCGEDCIEIDDKNVACYYARAIGRGRVLEEKLANPADHMGELISDFERVATLEPKWDEGGALRALAEIYLKMPTMPLWGNPAWVRDLEKAQEYAARAIAVAPQASANYQVAGEVAFAKKDYNVARTHFQAALQKLDQAKMSVEQKTAARTQLERWVRKCDLKLSKTS